MARVKAKQRTTEGIVGFRTEAVATREVSGENLTTFREIMKCNFGLTESLRSLGKVFYANGEVDIESKHNSLRITIEGSKKDIVNIMFDAALQRVGWRLKQPTFDARRKRKKR